MTSDTNRTWRSKKSRQMLTGILLLIASDAGIALWMAHVAPKAPSIPYTLLVAGVVIGFALLISILMSFLEHRAILARIEAMDSDDDLPSTKDWLVNGAAIGLMSGVYGMVIGGFIGIISHYV